MKNTSILARFAAWLLLIALLASARAQVGLNLNPSPFTDPARWAPIEKLTQALPITMWRAGYAIEPSGVVPKRPVRELVARAATAGVQIIYQHDPAAPDTDKKAVADLLPSGSVHFVHNEPIPLSTGIALDAFSQKTLASLSVLPGEKYGCSTHGFFHDAKPDGSLESPFNWETELIGCMNRGSGRLAKLAFGFSTHIYVALAANAPLPEDQARLKMLAVPAPYQTEVGLYANRPGFLSCSDWQYGYHLGRVCRVIVDLGGKPIIYASGDDSKGFAFIRAGAVVDARVQGFIAGFGR